MLFSIMRMENTSEEVDWGVEGVLRSGLGGEVDWGQRVGKVAEQSDLMEKQSEYRLYVLQLLTTVCSGKLLVGTIARGEKH